MQIFVNDEPREVSADAYSVETLFGDSGLPSRDGVAVAVNDGVVPRSQWAGRALNDGDRVLVIRATQGG
jgi:sulfur carrier protein